MELLFLEILSSEVALSVPQYSIVIGAGAIVQVLSGWVGRRAAKLIMRRRTFRRTARVICPSGKSAVVRENLSSPPRENIPLGPSGKSSLQVRASRLDKRGVRVVTNVGCGMRWTQVAAQDERRYSRTAKSCGPDAPTLASSWRKLFRRRRWQKSPVTGESTK